MRREASLTRVLPVRTRRLPAPDTLEYSFPDGYVCLVVDGGTDLTAALVSGLAGLGWRVVILRFPAVSAISRTTPSIEGVPVVSVAAGDEPSVATALESVTRGYGSVGAVVYLHPPSKCEDGPLAIVGANDRPGLRSLFVLAKLLRREFSKAAGGVRTSFITVTLMDGVLGTSGLLGDAPAAGDAPYAGGTIGLTKTLRMEWPETFCRAIDLDPAMGAEQAAVAILAELLDPDRRVVEVGYGPLGRITLEAVGVGEDEL